MHDELLRQHAALSQRAGLIELSDRTQIELRGDDRSTFLQGLCTNDILALSPGQGCEAFLPNAQGRILGYVFVFVGPDSIVLETSSGQQGLVQHLDKYIIRERVTLHDRSQEWCELLLAGPASASVVQSLAGIASEKPLSHGVGTVVGKTVWVRRADITGPPGYLIAGKCDQWSTVVDALIEAGAKVVDRHAFEAARIEAGSPLYGPDVTEANLPQEVGRDTLAISFRKGCYIGQETVARIDALGHVNRRLVGVRFECAEVPPVGTILLADDKQVGQVTSAAWSPRLKAPLTLAYVRRDHARPDADLDCQFGRAVVTKLPLS